MNPHSIAFMEMKRILVQSTPVPFRPVQSMPINATKAVWTGSFPKFSYASMAGKRKPVFRAIARKLCRDILTTMSRSLRPVSSAYSPLKDQSMRREMIRTLSLASLAVTRWWDPSSLGRRMGIRSWSPVCFAASRLKRRTRKDRTFAVHVCLTANRLPDQSIYRHLWTIRTILTAMLIPATLSK